MLAKLILALLAGLLVRRYVFQFGLRDEHHLARRRDFCWRREPTLLSWLDDDDDDDDHGGHPVNREYSLDKQDRSDWVAIVTGANQGLGLETVRELCRVYRIGTIYVTGKNESGVEAAAASLREGEMGCSGAIAMRLDLSSFTDVRNFAREFKRRHSRLDVLVNNGAVVQMPFTLTEHETLETQMQVNYMSPYLLTRLLLPEIANAPRSRIVHVSSRAAHFGFVDPALWSSPPAGVIIPGARQLYANSKLAQVLFNVRLAELLRSAGLSHVTTNAVHPGIVLTEAGRHAVPDWLYQYLPIARRLFTGVLFHTPRAAIQSQMYAVFAPEMDSVSGAFISSCRPRPATRFELYDANFLAELWRNTSLLIDPDEDVLDPDGLELADGSWKPNAGASHPVAGVSRKKEDVDDTKNETAEVKVVTKTVVVDRVVEVEKIVYRCDSSSPRENGENTTHGMKECPVLPPPPSAECSSPPANHSTKCCECKDEDDVYNIEEPPRVRSRRPLPSFAPQGSFPNYHVPAMGGDSESHDVPLDLEDLPGAVVLDSVTDEVVRGADVIDEDAAVEDAVVEEEEEEDYDEGNDDDDEGEDGDEDEEEEALPPDEEIEEEPVVAQEVGSSKAQSERSDESIASEEPAATDASRDDVSPEAEAEDEEEEESADI